MAEARVIDHITYKGRPLPRSVVLDINTLFAVLTHHRPVDQGLVTRLIEAGVEIPTPFPVPAIRPT